MKMSYSHMSPSPRLSHTPCSSCCRFLVVLWLCVVAGSIQAFVVTSPISPIPSPSSPFRSHSLFSHNPPDSKVIHGYTRSELQHIGRQSFQSHFTFPLDSWQTEAGGGIALGWNVIVTAPTGAGKTAVGVMALHHALQTRKLRGDDSSVTAVYTTPLKALSNQKFVELTHIFGTSAVGLSTGDMCIHRGAVLTVMTTEVYRNMCWKNREDIIPSSTSIPTIPGDSPEWNSMVVLDEFHYMGVVGRGGVWEEAVITSPKSTQLVALSATLSNAFQIGQWMEQVTRRPTLLVDVSHESRPVPLRYYFATTQGILPLFRDVDAGPGAPHGLLGLRDYGKIVQRKAGKDTKPKGFSKKDPGDSTATIHGVSHDLPKGLQLHPTLLRMEQQRMDKIHRIMTKKYLFPRRREGGNPRSNESLSNKEEKTFNPKTMNKQEKKERDQLLRQEMRKSVPSISFLVDRLQHMNLLPAIFFIFSRIGCDNAAEATCQAMRSKLSTTTQNIQESFTTKRKKIQYSQDDEDLDTNTYHPNHEKSTRHRSKPMGNIVQDKDGRSFRKQNNHIREDIMSSIMEGDIDTNWRGDVHTEDTESWIPYAKCGLLSLDEVTQIVSKVRSFNEQNPEIQLDPEAMERLFLGVGSHHAGQLPAHKALVETLFRAQLIKVVFATETLAAGINMPARTTVIGSLAKRGDDSNINLLETSSLLQMAGRAGRRGMDTDGTCIIVATPFEGPDSAIDILTREVKPVKSQFTPSYSLVVNLIARGNGTLDVAKTLVQSSFAYFEKEESEQRIQSAREVYGDDLEQVVQSASHEHYLQVLKDCITDMISSDRLSGNKQRLMHERVLQVLNDKNLLKKESKAYLSLLRIHDIEENTLKSLQREALEMSASQEALGLFDIPDDTKYLDEEILDQTERLIKCKNSLSDHVMTEMAIVANFLSTHEFPLGNSLRAAFNLARRGENEKDGLLISPLDLTTFAKSYVLDNKKRRKQDALGRSMGVSSPSLINSYGHVESFPDDAWKDTIALTSVLRTYGCIVDEKDENDSGDRFRITLGGNLLQELGLENSLWCIVALGGAWDVAGDSTTSVADNGSRYNGVETEYKFDVNRSDKMIPEPQAEAAYLVSCLRSLDASEMAGFISCLVSDESRGSASIVSSYERLTPNQRAAIQQALLSSYRLEEIQRMYEVDNLSGKVQIELAACSVVTAWTAGCSWAEALEISGLSPGDLIRTLHRALDALRQIGNLTYHPVRSLTKVQTESFGIHPEILSLCRKAASAMDRYPVKDTLLAFEGDNIQEVSEESSELDNDTK